MVHAPAKICLGQFQKRNQHGCLKLRTPRQMVAFHWCPFQIDTHTHTHMTLTIQEHPFKDSSIPTVSQHKALLKEALVWLWVKNVYPLWNPSTGNQGLKPAVPWRFNFDPYPSVDSVTPSQTLRERRPPQRGRLLPPFLSQAKSQTRSRLGPKETVGFPRRFLGGGLYKEAPRFGPWLWVNHRS